MKKIDKLLIQSFIPPFIVTFFIAIFVLMMQTLWLYIDDIAGKGASLFLIMEFLAYLSVSLVPMALPIAVLISSVMVLGNLAENYELSSMKSAGVSLARVMLPLMFVAAGISVLSFFCSNNLIPISNLQFKSRLYDMRKQKPTLSMEEGIFNDDFKGFSIRIGSKDPDGKTIRDVLIYDHSDASKGRLTQVVANEGEMFSSEDQSYFVMELRDGHQYVEGKSKTTGDTKSFPFIRTSFQEWSKIFDLSEFEMSETDKDLFKSHHSMLSGRQLLTAIDSIDLRIGDKYQNLEDGVGNFFHFKKKIIRERQRKEAAEKEAKRKEMEERVKKAKKEAEDKVEDKAKAEEKVEAKAKGWKEEMNKVSQIPRNRTVNVPPSDKPKAKPEKIPSRVKDSKTIPGKAKPKTIDSQSTSKKDNSKKKKNKSLSGKKPLEQKIDLPLTAYSSILETFPEKEHKRLVDKAQSSARNVHGQAETFLRSMYRIKESRVKHVYTYHSKYSMAVACFIFLFIGGPMGAIVRKGGFGYPLLIAIIFFMKFVVLTMYFKKMAESFATDDVLAAWLPCIILFPTGVCLTILAMRGAKMSNLELAMRLFGGRFRRASFERLEWVFKKIAP